MHLSWSRDIEEAEHVGTIPRKNGAADLGAVGVHNSAYSVAEMGNQAVVTVKLGCRDEAIAQPLDERHIGDAEVAPLCVQCRGCADSSHLPASPPWGCCRAGSPPGAGCCRRRGWWRRSPRSNVLGTMQLRAGRGLLPLVAAAMIFVRPCVTRHMQQLAVFMDKYSRLIFIRTCMIYKSM